MIRIGTSGWMYPPWRGTFYPKGARAPIDAMSLSQRLGVERG